jgi:hypothetical protein
MPDQVRHDRQNLSGFLNYDTVWKAGIHRIVAEKLDARLRGHDRNNIQITQINYRKKRHDFKKNANETQPEI